MTLLDPTLAIDLQYLGVHLPIPPQGASMETLSTSQGEHHYQITGNQTLKKTILMHLDSLGPGKPD